MTEPQPNSAAANIWVGPAGWSYADWKGIMYASAPSGSGRELKAIVEFFDTRG